MSRLLIACALAAVTLVGTAMAAEHTQQRTLR